MGCAAAFLLTASFWPNIFDETEGQYAGAAHEMLESGSWLVPTNNGIPRLQKPPLLYWLLRTSMAVFGQNEFAARLPNALATLGWIFLTYLIGKRVGGEKLGLFAAAIFSSFFGLAIFSHLIMPEPFLGLLLSLVFWCFLGAWRQPEGAARWHTWAWGFMGLGVMCKGLHGALLPLAVAGLTALFNRATRPFWRGLWSPLGLVLFLGITLPWYGAMAVKYPGFIQDHFLNEQIGHLADTRWPPDCARVPLGIFALQHFIFFWPWILFVPAAIWAWREKPHPLGHKFPTQLLWTWGLVVATGVLFSSRQDYYTSIAWGTLAVWLALPWVRQASVPRSLFFVPCMLVGMTGVALVITTLAMVPHVLASPASVSPAFERSDLFKSVHGFSLGAWREALWLFGVTGVAMLAGGAASAVLLWRRKTSVAGLVLAGMMLVPAAMVIRGYAMTQDYFSLAKIGTVLNSLAAPGAVVVCEGEPHQNASIFFYYDRHVHWVEARPDGDFVQRALNIGTELYLDDAHFLAWWASGEQVFLITEQSSLPRWQEKLGLTGEQSQPLARSGTRIVIANHQPGSEFTPSPGCGVGVGVAGPLPPVP